MIAALPSHGRGRWFDPTLGYHGCTEGPLCAKVSVVKKRQKKERHRDFSRHFDAVEAAEVLVPGLVILSWQSMVLRVVDNGENGFGRVEAWVEFLNLSTGKVWGRGSAGGYSPNADLRMQLLNQSLRWLFPRNSKYSVPEEWTKP